MLSELTGPTPSTQGLWSAGTPATRRLVTSKYLFCFFNVVFYVSKHCPATHTHTSPFITGDTLSSLCHAPPQLNDLNLRVQPTFACKPFMMVASSAPLRWFILAALLCRHHLLRSMWSFVEEFSLPPFLQSGGNNNSDSICAYDSV